jgi:hypothetical protein
MKQKSSSGALARKFTPSPSMVVALIALVVAMSGSAYAAVTINGKNIKKGTITAKQVKDKSLTGTDIKDKTVTGADVKDLSLGTADLADSSVTGSKLAEGSVSGGKIADGSVSGSKIAGGTIVPPPIGTATSASDFAVPGIAFSDVTGMTLNYTAPPGTTKLIITFSAACQVSYTSNAQYLATQIVVDGTEAAPAGGAGFQFCTVDPLDNYSQTGGQSMTRVIAASPGTHSVKVQAAEILISDGVLSDMALTVVPSS